MTSSGAAEPAATKLELAPLQGDPQDLGAENGVRAWSARTNDPAFLATAPASSPDLGPGWYRASALLEGRSGALNAPRLYLPDGQGAYSESRVVEMIPKGKAYVADFFLPCATRQIRFDPSNSPCEFACNALLVERIDEPRRQVAPKTSGGWLQRLRAGLHLGDSSPDADRVAEASPPTSRRRKELVLESIDREGIGVEIGPSHDPIAPKREGFKVHVIDHASRDELIGKYREHGVRLESIEEVDFIWRGQSYLELTGRPNHYDWIIASNVIEHTPDLIAFLQDCDSILKDGGVLCLVVPDKRYCFDRFRPITGLSKVIDSHLSGNRIHSPGSVAEYFMYAALKAGRHSWDARARGEYTFPHSAEQASEMIREVRERGAYLDIHNWCFVPHSFRLILDDLHALGFTKLREVRFLPTEGYEFHVTLGRHGQGSGKSRAELLRVIDAELAETDDPP